MSVTVSGTLVNPIGEPVVNAQITLTAIANSLTVLNTFSVTVSTNSSGAYRLQLEEGSYSITVAVNGRSFVYGSVTLDSTTSPSSLNQLLKQHIMESELTPEVILHFRELQQQVAYDRGAFSSIERRANQSAERAGQSRDEAQKYARHLSKTVAAVKGDRGKAEVSAAAAARSQTRAAASEAKATASQVAAFRSEENTKAYRDEAQTAAARAANEASTLAARQTGEKIQQQVKTDADRAQEAQNLSEQNKAAADKAAARIAQQQVKIEQAASRAANSDAAAKAAAGLAGQSQQSAAASARAAQQHAETSAANKQAAQGFRDETASLANAAKEAAAKRDVLPVALGGTGANTLAGAKEALGITALENDAFTPAN
ncbi:prophage tail fiber N-terminal domain-containing protein [Yersinia mollaretii]|uniref:prophage tail fiber N-terminal domain-containing protein n=1 Tax=Yersinia mollaretii TaxID=33060 RepID=UPI0011A50A0E|nr:prophage tail fiber N-terminal domain-containing protein [Yersinia mollaretii]